MESRNKRGVPILEDPEEKKKDQRPALTLELLGRFLEDAGISVSYNVIAKEIRIEGVPAKYNPETLTADVHIILHDHLKQVFRCSKDQVADLLGVTGGMCRFNPVLELLERLLPVGLSMHVIRKLAHFTEFAVLGVLAGLLFGRRRRNLLTGLLFSAMTGIATALCDETIQLFVPGRTGRASGTGRTHRAGRTCKPLDSL